MSRLTVRELEDVLPRREEANDRRSISSASEPRVPGSHFLYLAKCFWFVVLGGDDSAPRIHRPPSRCRASLHDPNRRYGERDTAVNRFR